MHQNSSYDQSVKLDLQSDKMKGDKILLYNPTTWALKLDAKPVSSCEVVRFLRVASNKRMSDIIMT